LDLKKFFQVFTKRHGVLCSRLGDAQCAGGVGPANGLCERFAFGKCNRQRAIERVSGGGAVYIAWLTFLQYADNIHYTFYLHQFF